jgi:hypothetical protein
MCLNLANIIHTFSGLYLHQPKTQIVEIIEAVNDDKIHSPHFCHSNTGLFAHQHAFQHKAVHDAFLHALDEFHTIEFFLFLALSLFFSDDKVQTKNRAI